MENIVFIASEAVFATATTILHFLFIHAFLGKKKNTYFISKIIIAFATPPVIFFTSLLFTESTLILAGVSTAYAFLVAFVFFGNKMGSSLIAAFCSVLFGGLAEIIAAFLITSIQNVPLAEMTQLSLYRLQGRTLTILFMLIVVVLTKRFRKGSIETLKTKSMLILILMPFVSIVIIQLYMIFAVTVTNEPTVYEQIPLFCILVSNIFVFVVIENLSRENEKTQRLMIIESQNEAQKNHLEQLKQNHHQILALSHDFRQQVQELYALCEKKEFEKLQTKLFELTNRRTKNFLIDTGNFTLDAILTSKIEIITNENIHFKKIFDIKPGLEYMESGICVLLGNALDNAIEACARSENDRFIALEIIAEPSQFLCMIKNSVGVVPQAEKKFLITSKKNKLHHGVGLQSMRKICDNLGGTMTFEYDEKYFQLWIKIIFM